MENFELFREVKPVQEIIDEVLEDLEADLFDENQKKEVIAKLEVARVTTLPESSERRKIDEFLRDIADRYRE